MRDHVVEERKEGRASAGDGEFLLLKVARERIETSRVESDASCLRESQMIAESVAFPTDVCLVGTILFLPDCYRYPWSLSLL